MSEVKIDRIRENRIANEAVVDAYEPEEIAMGWYYYLQERLNFPFKARWGSKSKSSDRIVMVLEMSSEDDCLNDMYVEVLYQEGDLSDVFSARLSEIHPLNVDHSKTPMHQEAIADWHYWIDRGYQF